MSSKNRYLSAMGLAAVAMLLVSGGESRGGDEPVVSEMRVAVPTVVVKDAHWLGVVCGPVDAALRAHLPIDAALRAHLDVPEELKDLGVMVNQVMKDSPAEKAGLKQYDILLKALDKPLTEPSDLNKAVEEADGKEMTLELIRSGKVLSVVVTPQKRPVESRVILYTSKGDPKSIQVITDWVTRLQKDVKMRPLKIRSVGPELIASSAAVKKDLPDDLRISITKQGKKPAEIDVKRADESWAVTENELDKLPDNVRPFVMRFLGRQLFESKVAGISLDAFAPRDSAKYHLYRYFAESDKPPQAASADVRKRLDQIERRLQEVVKELRAVKQLHEATRRAEEQSKKR